MKLIATIIKVPLEGTIYIRIIHVIIFIPINDVVRALGLGFSFFFLLYIILQVINI